ncbi:DUF1439 domain-containing protein [Verrucomicrobiaceae bacterium 227]
MKLTIGVMAGLILGAVLTIAGYFILRETRLGDEGITITFTEAEIQGRLGEKFPQSDRILEIFPVEIGEPRVRFLGESNRVELTMEADISVPLVQTYHSKGVFTTSIRYEPEDQTLRLSDITVEGFEVTDLPKKFEPHLRTTLTLAARKYLQDHPVHTLEPKDYKGEMVKMFLREIKVEKGLLKVRLGL